MKNNQFLKFGSWFLAFTALFWFSYLSFFWDGQDGGSDNFMHYRIAKYAFTYPKLFFNHWGKPVFTILSSAFAQLGFEGIEIFNSLLAVATFLVLIKILKHFDIRNSLALFIFLFCAPAYYYMVPTSMTEVLFGFWLTYSILLSVQKKHLVSAIFLGFIIWIRTEGFVLFIPFIAYYLLEKKWKAPLGLAIGWLTISLIGLPFKDSLLWFFNEMPYGDATEIYGRGSIFHYLKEYTVIWGPALGIAFIIAALITIATWIKKGIFKKSQSATVSLLAIGTSMAYLAAHSYSWYSGNGGSLGLTRVMACIIPPMALVSVFGLSHLPEILKKSRIWAYIPTGLLALWTLIFWITSTHIFYPENEMNGAVRKAAASFNKDFYDGQKIHYMIPSLIHYLEIDPYNEDQSHQYFDGKGLDEMKSGEILVWDAHHSPSEGKLPLDSLMKSRKFKLIDYYKPEFNFTVYNNNSFEVYFFEKIDGLETFDNFSLKDMIIEDKNGKLGRFELFTITDSTELNAEKPFGKAFELKTNEVAIDAPFKVAFEIEVLAISAEQLSNTHVVLSQVDEGEAKYYGSISLNALADLKPNGTWQKVSGKLYPNMKFQSALLRGYVYTTNDAVSSFRNLKFIAVEMP